MLISILFTPLDISYNIIKFLYILGFSLGWIYSFVILLNTIIERDLNHNINFNFYKNFSYMNISIQFTITKTYFIIFLPFITSVIPTLFFINFICYTTNKIKIIIELTEEYNKRKKLLIINNFIEEKPEYCPVCIEKFENKIKPLSCGHFIHKNCVIRSGKTNCPLCKKEVKLTIEEFIKIKYK